MDREEAIKCINQLYLDINNDSVYSEAMRTLISAYMADINKEDMFPKALDILAMIGKVPHAALIAGEYFKKNSLSTS